MIGSEMEDEKFITIPVSIDRQTLWEATFGGGWEYSSWWVGLKYGVGGAWDEIGDGTFILTCEDPDDENAKPIKKTLTIDDLARAWGIAVQENYHHCGTSWDLEDTDHCVSDGLLQLAFFGEIIYG
jgi:hypothetical protein